MEYLRNLNAKHIFLLMITAVWLWLLSIRQAGLEMGDLGLISILPPTYFISVVTLTFCFLITVIFKRKNQKLLFLQLILLVFFLYSTPTLIEGTARFHMGYEFCGYADFITRNGHIDPLKVEYHSWPGFNILSAMLIEVTRIPPLSLLTIFPVFAEILYFFPLYAFFRGVLNDEAKRWVATFLFYVTNWVCQDYFSSQGFAFFLVILMFALMLKIGVPNVREKGFSYCFVTIFLFSSLVVGHFLSSLAMLAILCVLSVLKYLRNLNLAALATVLLASWTIYGAAVFLEFDLLNYVSQILNIEMAFESNVVRRVAGAPGHVLVTNVRILFSVMVFHFALSGFLLSRKLTEIKHINKRILAEIIGMMPLLILFFYGGEMFERIYFFSLVPLMYFACQNLESKRMFAALIIFLLIASPLFIITRYGNERIDYVRLGEIKGAEFFYDMSSGGYIIGGGTLCRFKNYEQYGRFSFLITKWENNILKPVKQLKHELWLQYVYVDRANRERYCLLFNDLQFINELCMRLDRSPYYNKVFSNADLDLYLYNPTKLKL